jgi:nucleoside-diphosphate kinase
MQRTLAIIKPDAYEQKFAGKIISRIIEEGFSIRGMRLVHLSRQGAAGLYEVHKERPFYGQLLDFMSSGPAIIMALECDDAIARWRELIGPTNPTDAPEGTLRKLYATNVERNAVHGSDSPASADQEISYFFSGLDLV